VASTLHLSLACGLYDINEPLLRGEITAQGIDLNVQAYPSPERHRRMSQHLEFDVCEFSLATYLMIHDQGVLPVTAIPAFPHRRFRHGFVFVNSAAGIREPGQLTGRRIGIRNWATTAGVWARGLLADDYGVDLKSITWVAQDEEDVPLEHAGDYRIERASHGQTVTAMLETGELDALIYPELPRAVLAGDARIRPLFADARQAEIAWFERTRIFPIMHTVLVRQAIVEAHPWVARNLLTAFQQSKDRAFEAMRDPRRVSLAWFREAFEEQRRILGDDPWAYAFEPNRHALETMIRYAHEQGMIARRFPPEDLFERSTLETLPAYV
jgi:4,5-dihydroxyphthalate decarboxylase